jgi:hypothetical protein
MTNVPIFDGGLGPTDWRDRLRLGLPLYPISGGQNFTGSTQSYIQGLWQDLSVITDFAGTDFYGGGFGSELVPVVLGFIDPLVQDFSVGTSGLDSLLKTGLSMINGDVGTLDTSQYMAPVNWLEVQIFRSVQTISPTGISSTAVFGATKLNQIISLDGVVFRSVSVLASSAVALITLNVPPGIQPTDVLVAAIETNTTFGVTPPTGWTLIAEINGPFGSLHVYWALGSVVSHTFMLPSATLSCGFEVAFMRVNATPIDVVGANQDNPDGTIITAPSVVTVTDEARFVCVFGYLNMVNANVPTFVIGPGLTDRAQGGVFVAATVALDIGDGIKSPSGATGTKTTTASMATFGGNDGITAALRPQVVGGISSGQAFGFARLVLNIKPIGISSAEAFGSTNTGIHLIGIPSAQAFGNATISSVVSAQTIRPAGISSAEAFGATRLQLFLKPTGISSTEAFGFSRLQLYVKPFGIPSFETFGALRTNLFIKPAGIASAEAFGTSRLILYIKPQGILSAEQFGNVNTGIHLTGISSAETFGVLKTILNVKSGGISSSEAFGTARLNLVVRTSGILSLEVFGVFSVVRVLKPSGIATGEVEGTLRLVLYIRPNGILTFEVFGNSNTGIHGIGIPSAEALGIPSFPGFGGVPGITIPQYIHGDLQMSRMGM